MVKTDRRPVFQLHAECQAVSGKNFLNFVKGLAAKVWSLEQFVFGSLDQVADIVNIFGLEAVGGTNGKFKVVDRTTKDRINRRLRFGHRSFDRGLRLHCAESRLRSNGFETDGGQSAEDGELIDRIDRLNRTLEELNRTLNEKKP